LPVLMLWGVIRSRSTAFFRMMAERSDFLPLHEPFSFLAEFGYVDICGSRCLSEAAVIEQLRVLGSERSVFVKDTTDERYPGVLADHQFLAKDAVHTFLIRHPSETIASYHAINPAFSCEKIGFHLLFELFSQVTGATGREPLVLDSEDLVRRPVASVSAYCEQVGIDFQPQALTWRSPEIRKWAPSERWHSTLMASTSLGDAPRRGRANVDADPLLSECLSFHLPFYEKLYSRRLIV
jgi:Sulfotransferase domain